MPSTSRRPAESRAGAALQGREEGRAFYKKAFDAKELVVIPARRKGHARHAPDRRLVFMLGQECAEMPEMKSAETAGNVTCSP